MYACVCSARSCFVSLCGVRARPSDRAWICNNICVIITRRRYTERRDRSSCSIKLAVRMMYIEAALRGDAAQLNMNGCGGEVERVCIIRTIMRNLCASRFLSAGPNRLVERPWRTPSPFGDMANSAHLADGSPHVYFVIVWARCVRNGMQPSHNVVFVWIWCAQFHWKRLNASRMRWDLGRNALIEVDAFLVTHAETPARTGRNHVSICLVKRIHWNAVNNVYRFTFSETDTLVLCKPLTKRQVVYVYTCTN